MAVIKTNEYAWDELYGGVFYVDDFIYFCIFNRDDSAFDIYVQRKGFGDMKFICGGNNSLLDCKNLIVYSDYCDPFKEELLEVE